MRFDKELKEYWETKHEVKYEPGASEFLFQWCDLYYCNYWDNNIHYLYKWHMEHSDVKKPKIVCRAIDWEIWQGLVRDQRIVDWVDVAICIAPHMEKRLLSEMDFKGKLHLIKPGIGLDKWTYRVRNGGHEIVMPVNELDWYLKHTIEGLKIFAELVKIDPEYKMTVRGKWCQSEYMRVLIQNFIEISGIKDKVTIDEEWVENLDQRLEKFDYMLLPSLKEAFSFVTAQCAAKGIRPILNQWYGADGIWPKSWLYRTPQEAVAMITDKNYCSSCYRNLIDKKYNVKRMCEEYDKACGT